jgi:hypothetical protein
MMHEDNISEMREALRGEWPNAHDDDIDCMLSERLRDIEQSIKKCEYCGEVIPGIPVVSQGEYFCNTDCWEQEMNFREIQDAEDRKFAEVTGDDLRDSEEY